MDNNEIEEPLNVIVEDLYQGIKNLAKTVRDQSKSREDIREDIAVILDKLAFDFCRHWPFCNTVHKKELDAYSSKSS